MGTKTDTFVLYCKSYKNDVLRAIRLTESVQRFNRDRLPFYISVPEQDLPLFRKHLTGFQVTLLKDEDILLANPRHTLRLIEELSGGLLQQIIKSEFWRLGVCKNYLVLDSDAYFIKDFMVADFMYSSETPYTIMHEAKEILCFSARQGMSKVRRNFVKDRIISRQLFDRQGRLFEFGPIPAIWSMAVWKALDEQFAAPQGLGYADLIRQFPSELLWYGEALLKYEPIRLMPIEPLFKVFHYKEQFEESLAIGENETVLSENYWGIVKQSTWDTSTDDTPRRKRSWKTLWLKR